jgi:hypothetical protein
MIVIEGQSNTLFKKYHPSKFLISYTNPYQTSAILKTFINVNHPEELNEINITKKTNIV